MDTTKFVTKIYLIENKEIVTKLRNPQLVFSYMAELLVIFFKTKFDYKFGCRLGTNDYNFIQYF